MKSTWKKSDAPRRRNMTIGCTLFVIGVGTTAYCGYLERYVGDPQPEGIMVFGWALLLLGLVLFLLGILQSPIRRD